MRILVLSEPFIGLKKFFYGLTDKDSGQPAFYRVIQELDKNGHQVFIIVPTYFKPSKYSILGNHIEIFAYHSPTGFWIWKLLDRIRLGSLKLRFIFHFVLSTYYGIKITKRRKFDTVIGHWEFATLSAFLVGKIRGIQNISRLYGSNIIGRTKGALLWRKLFFHLNRLVPFVAPANLYICTNDGTQSDKVARFFKIPRSKFIHILNGVDRENLVFQKTKKDNKIHITFIGHLSGWKNPMRLLELAPLVVAINKEVIFHFIGDGNQERLLRAYIKEKNLKDFVILHGRLTQEEKNRILSMTDIYVSFYSFSNLSNTTLEALSFGKAIITIDNGDTSLVLKNGENAVVLPRWNKELAKNELLQMINNPQERKKLAKKAKVWADENLISWEERAALEINYYKKLINNYR